MNEQEAKMQYILNQKAVREEWDREYKEDIDRVLASIEEEAAAAQRFLSDSRYDAVYASLRYIAREADGWARDIKKDGLNE